MWSQASNPVALNAISNVTTTPPPMVSLRDRLTSVRAALIQCLGQTEQMAHALEPRPTEASGPAGKDGGPMGVEMLTADLERMTNLLTERLGYLASRLG